MEKKLAHQLRDVTEATTRLYGNDLQIAERLLSRLLTFETQQSGFGLTATQDAYFNEVKITYFWKFLYTLLLESLQRHTLLESVYFRLMYLGRRDAMRMQVLWKKEDILH